MDFEENIHTLTPGEDSAAVDPTSFNEYFHNWVGSKVRNKTENRESPIVEDNMKTLQNNYDEEMDMASLEKATMSHKTKKLRVLVKRLPRKITTTNALVEPTVSKNWPGRHRWLDAMYASQESANELPKNPKLSDYTSVLMVKQEPNPNKSTNRYISHTDIKQETIIEQEMLSKFDNNQMNSDKTSTNDREDESTNTTLKTLVNKTTCGQPRKTHQGSLKKIEAVLLKDVNRENEVWNAPIVKESKTVQTQFTCNENISGIIDSKVFNIHCFFCLKTFHIQKWKLFLNHIKKCQKYSFKKIEDLLRLSDYKGSLGGLKRTPQNKVNEEESSTKRSRSNTKSNASLLNSTDEEISLDEHDFEDDVNISEINENSDPSEKELDEEFNTDQNYHKLLPTEDMQAEYTNMNASPTTKNTPNMEYARNFTEANTNTTEETEDEMEMVSKKSTITIERVPPRLFPTTVPYKQRNNKGVPLLTDLKTNINKKYVSNTPISNKKFLKIVAPKENGREAIANRVTLESNKNINEFISPKYKMNDTNGKKTSEATKKLVHAISSSNIVRKDCIKLSMHTAESPSKESVKVIGRNDKESPGSRINNNLNFSRKTPTITRKFVKLVPTIGRINGKLELPRNLPIVEFKNGKLSNVIGVENHNISASSSTPMNLLSTDLKDVKSKIINLPANMKIVRKTNTVVSSKENSPAETLSIPMISEDEKSKLDAQQSVKANKSDEENESTKSPFTSKIKADSKNSNSVLELPYSPCSTLISYSDFDEKMDEDQDTFTNTTQICEDSANGDKSNIRPVITTSSLASTKSMSDNTTSKPMTTTTIEVIAANDGESTVNEPNSNEEAPFPSRYLDSEDEMPSNDENEDEFPSSTNGCGILFGLTNSNIVTEFLKELEKYPDLYKFNPKKESTLICKDNIIKLSEHINEKFKIDMTEFEIRLSIQRIKYWYCRTLQKMNEWQRTNPKKPFKHTFPKYFKIMQRFLTYDVNYTKDLVLGRRFYSDQLQRYPTWMLWKPGTGPLSTSNKNRDTNAIAASPSIKHVKPKDLVLEFDEDELLSDEEEVGRPSSPSNPIVCDICFVDFERRIDLRRHRIEHFPPSIACLICARKHYTRRMAAKCSHGKKKVASINPLRKFVCDVCGSCYKSMGALNYHIQYKHLNKICICEVCNYTCPTNYRLVQHQIKRHIVEFGTWDEILRRTRPRTIANTRFTTEEQKEFVWRREMRKHTKPGEHFFGCYKCQLVFKTRAELLTHNRTQHPIKEKSVLCLLCRHENALFANLTSVRRHYSNIHKVPLNTIDDLVKRTKQLWKLFTESDIELLNSSNNRSAVIAQMLAKYGNDSEISEYTKLLNSGKMVYRDEYYDDEFNDDDLGQSTLYNEFDDCGENDEYSEFSGAHHKEYDNEASSCYDEELNENNGELYIAEEIYEGDYLPFNTDQTTTLDNDYGKPEIIEQEIIIDNDIDELMED